MLQYFVQGIEKAAVPYTIASILVIQLLPRDSMVYAVYSIVRTHTYWPIQSVQCIASSVRPITEQAWASAARRSRESATCRIRLEEVRDFICTIWETYYNYSSRVVFFRLSILSKQILSLRSLLDISISQLLIPFRLPISEKEKKRDKKDIETCMDYGGPFFLLYIVQTLLRNRPGLFCAGLLLLKRMRRNEQQT